MKAVAGVDGGGTHTRAIAVSLRGEILGRGEGGPSNWQTVGVAAAVAAVRDAVRAASAGGRLAGVGACLAGVDLPEDAGRLAGPLQAALGCPVLLENDIAAALYAAPAHEAAAVSAGTGAAVGWRDGQEVHRLLALNRRTGPSGGAGDIAEMALRAAILALQGAGPATLLAREVPQALGCVDLLALVRGTQMEPGPEATGLLAPLCARLAAAGDAVAQAILRACGRALGDAAGRYLAAQGLPAAAAVDLHGALLRGGPPQYGQALRRALRRRLPNRLRSRGPGALAGAGIFAVAAFSGDLAAARARLLG